jgi:hypothetical protein
MRYIPLVLLIGISMTMCSQTLLPVKKNGKYGYIDADGNVKIEAQYTYASYFKNQRAIVLRNDTAFLLYQSNVKLLFPNIRNVKEFDNGAFAFQDFSGLWALSDSSLLNRTNFEFNQLYEYMNCLVVNKNKFNYIYYKDLSRALKDSFQQISCNENDFVKCINEDTSFIYRYHNDSLKFVVSGNMVYHYYNCYVIKKSKREKDLKVYSLKGEFLKEGIGFENGLYLSPYLTFTLDKMVYLFNENTGEIIAENNHWNQFKMVNSIRNCILDSTDLKMYFQDFTIDLKSLGYQSSYFIDSNHMIAINDSFSSIVNINSEVLFSHPSMLIFKITKDLVTSMSSTETVYFSLKHRKVVLRTPVDYQVSFDDGSIMVNKPNSTVLYSIDEKYQILDSGVFNNVAFLNAGRRTSYFPDDNNWGANVAARNMSVNRYFYVNSRRSFGLLGFNNDTLLKPFLYSINPVNDSIDLVTINQRRSRPIFKIRNSVLSSVEYKYGLLNNRTGKFVLNPKFYYLEINDFKDSTTNMVKTVLENGKFALMNKSTFEIQIHTICDYLKSETGNIYIAYHIKRLHSNKSEKTKNELRKFWVSNFNYFTSNNWSYPIQLEGNIELFNSRAESILDSSILSQIKSLSNLIHDNFIYLNKNNQQGVLNIHKGIIVKADYYNIEPLNSNDSFYVLSNLNPRFGYLNHDGEVLTEAKFKKAEDFKNGFAWCMLKDSILLLDSMGNEVGLEFRNYQKKTVSEGLIAIRTGKGWQFVDLNGNALNEKLYKSVGTFINGYAAVRSRKGWGIIDDNDNYVLEPKYEKLYAENANSFVFLHKDKYLFFSRDGIFKSKLKNHGKLMALNDDLYKIENSSFSFVYDNNGDKYIKRKMSIDVLAENDTLYSIKNKRVIIYKGKKRQKSVAHRGGLKAIEKQKFEPVRMKKGQEYLEFKIYPCFQWMYSEIIPDSVKNIKIKVVNNQVKWVKIVNKNMVSCMKLNAFVGQRVADNQYILIDSLGNFIIDKIFVKLEFMGMDLFKATYINDYGKEVTGVLNRYGIWVLPPRFEDIRNFSEGKAIYLNNKGYLIADVNGNLISEEMMTDIELIDQYFLLKSDNKVAWWHPYKGFITQFD